MITRFRHHFSLSVPLFTFGALFFVGLFGIRTLVHVVAAEQVTPMEFALGEGIDVASARLAVVGAFLPRLAQEAGTLTMVAIVATGISLIAVVVHIMKMVRGFGDIRRFTAYLVSRIKLVSWNSRDKTWGMVKDIETGEALPFTQVHLMDGDHTILASTIADARGEYRFRPALSRAFSAGFRLQAIKDGYYFPPSKRKSIATLVHYHGGPLPTVVSAVPSQLDILMDSAGGQRSSSLSVADRALQSAGTVAFLASVALVPLALTVSTGPLTAALVAGLAVSTAGRIATR
jgi:hypothetical protein